MSVGMELAQWDRLSELVEELTTSGQPQLDYGKMKELKRIFKVSNNCVDKVYHALMSQLKQEHAEIRLSAFQIASELFSRSHQFRILLVDNFQEFLELTVETDTEQRLPPPKAVAKKLKSSAIQTVQSWQASYGSAYKKLALGYHFLKQVKKVDFQDVEARTVAERRRQEDRQERMEKIYRERVEVAARDMEESYQDIEAVLAEMESCMKLLLPDDFSDIQTTNGSPASSQPANECSSVDERPCCSRDLRRGGKEREEKTDDVEEKMDGEEGSSEGAVEEEEEDGRDEGEEALDEDLFIRNSGLISHSYSLDINLDPDLSVKETEDNEAVVSTVIDLNRLITTKHLPAVQSWILVFTKSGAEQKFLRRALDLKKSLEAALQKHKELHINYKTRVRRVMKACADGEEDEDESEDDFQEVPEKEGFELRAEYGLEPTPSPSTEPTNEKPPHKRPVPPPRQSSSSSSKRLKQLIEEEQDPTCAAATLRLLRQCIPLPTASSGTSSSQHPTTGPSTALGSGPSMSASISDQKDVEVPVVPFGLDLYYWGEDQPSAGKIIKSASKHQFWVPCEVEGEEVENDDMSAESKSRYISFPGTFTPVTHHCGAPLGTGKLCQRQDRVKCPFHGRIIPRDEEGCPSRQGDRIREEQEQRKRREEQPDWRDAELMREIEAVTGEDLGSHRLCCKRKGKKKYPKLSNLNQNANTARSRLQRIVFNKNSMRRVAEAMDKADKRKHDKFSNQFNYALN